MYLKIFQTRQLMPILLALSLWGIPGINSPTVQAQGSFKSFAEEHHRINQQGMYILGGWALANMVSGGIGWATTDGSAKYFHQMNVFWNTVNVSLATVGLLSGNRQNAAMTEVEFLSKSRRTENIFLINAGLDILYIGTGGWLFTQAEKNIERKDLMTGYGQSLMVQGGFLLMFDAVMYALLKHKRIKYLDNLHIGPLSRESAGVQLRINF